MVSSLVLWRDRTLQRIVHTVFPFQGKFAPAAAKVCAEKIAFQSLSKPKYFSQSSDSIAICQNAGIIQYSWYLKLLGGVFMQIYGLLDIFSSDILFTKETLERTTTKYNISALTLRRCYNTGALTL